MRKVKHHQTGFEFTLVQDVNNKTVLLNQHLMPVYERFYVNLFSPVELLLSSGEKVKLDQNEVFTYRDVEPVKKKIPGGKFETI
jgi:hypothetical protein